MHPTLLRLATAPVSVAVSAVLICTSVSIIDVPISIAESAVVTTQQLSPPPPQQITDRVTAQFTPEPQTPAKPAKRKRRRHHFWLWHFVPGAGGPLSWLLLVPYLIVGLAVAAIIVVFRRRRANAANTPPVHQAWNAFAPNTIQPVGIQPAHIPPADERLQRLSDLHAKGMLTDDEFETQRLRILGT